MNLFIIGMYSTFLFSVICIFCVMYIFIVNYRESKKEKKRSEDFRRYQHDESEFEELY